MDGIELLGYLAAVLLIASFFEQTMMQLRCLAIAGSLAFIACAALAEVWPMVALCSVVLSINLYRLWQAKRILREVKSASPLGLRLDFMIPGMGSVTAHRGHVLFNKGDHAKMVYYILSGSVRVADRGMVLGKGEMLGEMAMFTADGKRTDTAICATDVELAAIDESAMWRVLQDSPEFGLYLIRRLVGRSVSANAAGSANRGGVASLAA